MKDQLTALMWLNLVGLVAAVLMPVIWLTFDVSTATIVLSITLSYVVVQALSLLKAWQVKRAIGY